MLLPNLAVVCTAALASLAAQDNKFEIYPDAAGTATSYVDRMNLGGNAGELLYEVPDARFRGVGDFGPACTAEAFVCTTSDENASTPETYSIVLRTPLVGGAGPDPSAAGVIVQVGPLQTPPGTGRLGWILTTSFATPVAVPCEGGWYMGIAVQAASWTSDGQSLYMAFYPGFFNPPAGDNPRAGAPNHSWWIMNGLTGLSQYSHTVAVGVRTRAPVLNVGGIDPNNTRQSPPGSTNFGAGGMYPDHSGSPRSDGIEIRVLDAANSGGIALLMLSSGYLPFAGGVGVPGIGGRLWIDFATLLPLANAPIAGGTAFIPVAPAGALPPSVRGFTAHFQAFTVDPSLGNPRFSNAATTSL
jgi:hypothetical protein